MSNPILDPNLPADHAPIVSGELRNQFQAIHNSLDDLNTRLCTVGPLGGSGRLRPAHPGRGAGDP